MKTKKFLTISGLIISLISLAIFACTKFDLDQNSNIAAIHDEQDSINPDNADIVYEDTGVISISNVSVENGILKFNTMSAFKLCMGEIVNHSIEAILDWESEINFTSKYGYLKEIEEDSNIDDYENLAYHLGDPYFECVINPLNKIIIDDTLYTYDFDDNELVITYPDQSDTTLYLGGGSFYVIQSTECGNCKTSVSPKYYNGGVEKLGVYKWLSNFKIYASFGIASNYFYLNSQNKWKSLQANQLNLFIDQWHVVEYYPKWNPNAVGIISNKRRVTEGKNHNTFVLAWLCGIPSEEVWQGFCIVKFERFHCYKENFNDDLHHDIECH